LTMDSSKPHKRKNKNRSSKRQKVAIPNYNVFGL
jgi:hypothetical protein